MKNLVIIGHPDQSSFCYNGIFKTIVANLEKADEDIEVIDLYRDSFTRPRDAVIGGTKNWLLGLIAFILFLPFGGLDLRLEWKYFLTRY